MKTEKTFRENYFKAYDILIGESLPYKKLLTTVLSELEIKPGEKVLDAGCGTGNFVKELIKLKAKVVTFDNSLFAIKICKAKVPQAKIFLLDLLNPLPFSADTFDKIILNNVLYLIPPEKRIVVLKELWRVLKPNGKIALTNPKKGGKNIKIFMQDIKSSFQEKGLYEGIKRLKKALKSVFLILPPYLKKVNQKMFLSKQEQESLLQESGFKIIKTLLVYADQAILTIAQK
ncbi:MAG: class I SAM-dependent methyltransferase [Candidatus Pacebacteria bacterium]|nr:class I SAM-dependent methyltransferase [Candidatus Paceibacterota bacterium]